MSKGDDESNDIVCDVIRRRAMTEREGSQRAVSRQGGRYERHDERHVPSHDNAVSQRVKKKKILRRREKRDSVKTVKTVKHVAVSRGHISNQVFMRAQVQRCRFKSKHHPFQSSSSCHPSLHVA